MSRFIIYLLPAYRCPGLLYTYCLPIDVHIYYIAIYIWENAWNRDPKAGIDHLLCWIQLSYPNGLELNCLTREMSGVGGHNCNTGLDTAFLP